MFEIDLAGLSNEPAPIFSPPDRFRVVLDAYKHTTAHLTVRKARALLRQIARGEE